MTENGFSYYVHGFSLHSEIECPELLPWGGDSPDVRVQLRSLEHIRHEATHPVKHRRIGEQHMLLDADGVGRFSVRDGREVIVAPLPRTDMNLLRQFLFGSVFGCLIHQRGLLPMHANAFLHKGEAVLVLAHSGTGKSTLAAEMKNRGHKILADDVCAVRAVAGEQPVVYPGVPQIKLWRDAAEHFGEDVGSLRQVIHKEEKYAMPVLEHYCARSVPIKALYIMNAGSWDKLQIIEPGRIEMIDALKNYTFRRNMVGKLGIEAAHLRACAILEKSVRVRRILRPKTEFLLDELADLLERDLP